MNFEDAKKEVERNRDKILQIEKNDPQFKALKELSKKKDTPEFFRLVLSNALMSYQLGMKGEEYWKKFSEFFAESSEDDFEDFIKRYNKRFLKAKLKRLKKVQEVVKSTLQSEADVKFWASNLKLLVKTLAERLNQAEDAKTVVFAAKMFIYAYRAKFGENLMSPMGIMIPIDVRISKISKDKEFWKRLERETKVPLLHIDSIFWLRKTD